MTERSFQKTSKTSSKPKPQILNVWGKIFKSGGNKKLWKERKEIFSSFERKSAGESLAQNIPEWPSPSHARKWSFTHDGYIRRTATEMIILMTDIVRHMALNGLIASPLDLPKCHRDLQALSVLASIRTRHFEVFTQNCEFSELVPIMFRNSARFPI